MKYDKKILKIAGSLFFIAILYFKVDWGEAVKVLLHVDLKIYFLSLLIFLGNQLLSSYKWKILLEARGVFFSLPYLFKLYLFGYIFNFVLPSNVGGDLAKVYRLIKKNKNYGKINIILPTVLERFLGLAALLILIFAALFFNSYLEWRIRAAAIIFMSALFLILFLLIKKEAYASEGAIKILEAVKLKSKFLDLIKALEVYKKDKKYLAKGLLISILFHLSGIFNQFLLFAALGVKIPILFLFFAVPLNRLIIALPVSFGGLGLNEFSLIKLLEMVGVASDRVIAYSLLGYFPVLLITAVYILYIVYKKIIRFFCKSISL